MQIIFIQDHVRVTYKEDSFKFINAVRLFNRGSEISDTFTEKYAYIHVTKYNHFAYFLKHVKSKIGTFKQYYKHFCVYV